MLLLFIGLLVAATSVQSAKYGDVCYKEYSQKPHEFHNNLYYRCLNGQWELQYCPTGYVYDEISGYCYLPATTQSPYTTRDWTPGRQLCRPGERVRDVFDNTKYRTCSWDGKEWITHRCAPGSIYIPKVKECRRILPRPTQGPWTSTTTPTSNNVECYESSGASGYKEDIYNCKNFYQCASGRWRSMRCGDGTIWNQQILACDHDRGQCRASTPWPQYTTTQPTF